LVVLQTIVRFQSVNLLRRLEISIFYGGTNPESPFCTVYFIFFSLRTKYFPWNLLSRTRLSIICFALNLGDQVSHPFKTTGKVALHFLMCMLLDRRWGDRFWQNSKRKNLITACVLGCGGFVPEQCSNFAQIFHWGSRK